ncbi:MAG: MarR family transcriptional regulator [Eubacteriales bacterium]|nr:MarR family transcriptional regulator [Eubacteriales bacterium]
MEISRWLAKYNALSKESDNLYRGLVRELGGSECALWILYTLRAEKPPVTQKTICDILHAPKQTVNSAMKALEAGGYLRLEPGPDRRRKQVVLTEAGERLARGSADKIIFAEEAAFEAMTESEREMFLILMGRFVRALREEIQEIKREETEA